MVSPPPPTPPVDALRQPLRGVRVLDLSRLLPGPWATQMLVDMGADVVKVEDPGQGDYTRWMPPLVGPAGAPFVNLNRGKRSIVIDLKAAPGREVFLRLCRSFDVVVEGFRPGVLDRLGVGYTAASAGHGGLIWCSITGYGQTGPLRDRAGHDLDYCALGGILAAQGPAGGPPQMAGVQVADIGGGSLLAVTAILGALLARQATGQGQHLDVSMTEGALAFLPLHLAGVLAGEPPPPRGEHLLAGGLVNYGIYETADGAFMALGALEPRFWERFLAAVGRPDLTDALSAQGPDREHARAAVAEIFRGRTRAAWEALAVELDACLEPVLSLEEVGVHSLHRSRGMVQTVDQPGFGPLEVLMTPTPFSRAWAGQTLPGAPDHGEHTDAVLREAGFSDDEVAALRRQEAVS